MLNRQKWYKKYFSFISYVVCFLLILGLLLPTKNVYAAISSDFNIGLSTKISIEEGYKSFDFSDFINIGNYYNTYDPDNSPYTPVYSSSNMQVATIDSSTGVVTMHSQGSTVITVTIEHITKSCTLQVIANTKYYKKMKPIVSKLNSMKTKYDTVNSSNYYTLVNDMINVTKSMNTFAKSVGYKSGLNRQPMDIINNKYGCLYLIPNIDIYDDLYDKLTDYRDSIEFPAVSSIKVANNSNKLTIKYRKPLGYKDIFACLDLFGDYNINSYTNRPKKCVQNASIYQYCSKYSTDSHYYTEAKGTIERGKNKFTFTAKKSLPKGRYTAKIYISLDNVLEYDFTVK